MGPCRHDADAEPEAWGPVSSLQRVGLRLQVWKPLCTSSEHRGKGRLCTSRSPRKHRTPGGTLGALGDVEQRVQARVRWHKPPGLEVWLVGASQGQAVYLLPLPHPAQLALVGNS